MALPSLHRFPIAGCWTRRPAGLLLLLFCSALAAPQHIDLPKSSVTLPWSVFQSFSQRKPDTVFITPKGKPPVAAALGEMQVTAVLHDSVVEMSLSVYYTVLSEQGWAEVKIFPGDKHYALSSVSLPAGDFLRMTEDGYVLTADAGKGKTKRRLLIAWTAAVRNEEGVSSLGMSLPPALQCALDIVAPASFTEVAAGEAYCSGKERTASTIHYHYLMGAPFNDCEITYKIPIKTAPADSVIAEKPESGSKQPVITARQELIVFPTKGNIFAYTALHLNVIRAPITRFTIELPDSFTLLTITGSGIRSWKRPKKGNVIEVELEFKLEGNYTLHCAGELPADTVVTIPVVKVREATHQTGIFACGIEKETEALFRSINNCVGISLDDFSRGLSLGFADSIMRYDHSLRDIALAGQYFKLPFSANVLLRRHGALPVADAICDGGSIRTVISKDAKMLTQANFLIRHRDRQFISLRLPDSASLWSFTVDGVSRSPSKDNNGSYKISLQRHMSATSADRPTMLEFTYLQTVKTSASGGALRLTAPVPGIPVVKLDWTVFYPDRWNVKKVTGSFTASRIALLGERFHQLDRNEQRSLYGKLQQSNTDQQAGAGGASALSLMPPSPKHLYASTILVVDEQPWMEIRFGSATAGRLLTMAEIGAVIGLLTIGGVAIRRRMRKAKS